jgi:hypothetical protein
MMRGLNGGESVLKDEPLFFNTAAAIFPAEFALALLGGATR